jgi:1,2-diacylglycerol 3-alpha-glucosyltransferase
MKVIIVQPWIDYRGAETTCVYLAYYLQKLGVKVKIVSLYKDEDSLPHFADEVEISTLPPKLAKFCQTNRLILFIFGFPLLFLKTFFERDVSLINAHNLPSYWIAALIGRLKKIPVVWTAHTIPFKLKLSESRDLIDFMTWFLGASFIDKIFVSYINEIIVSSEFAQGIVRERYERTAKIVPLGINLNLFKLRKSSSIRQKYKLARSTIILSVGSLRADKNHEVLIKAFKKVSDTCKDCTLVICGSGPEEEKLKELVKNLGLMKNVIFTGFIKPKDLADYYKAADVFVLPSKLETWGLTVFEALSQKTPPIVSPNVGSAKVLIKENIGLVTGVEIEDLSKSILLLLKNNSLAREFGKRGYKFVQTKLSWDKYAKECLSIFNEQEHGEKRSS